MTSTTPAAGTIAAVRMVALKDLVLSPRNVRRVAAKGPLSDLADDIALRGLLQSLNVRPVLKGKKPTGKFEVVEGGRRYAALNLLVDTNRLSADCEIPCVVKERASTLIEADSLAANSFREQLHPLDQYRAFRALADRGIPQADIAAQFGVTAAVVAQRLRLTMVSPALLDAYADDQVSLAVLEAMSITDNHARQEAAFNQLSSARRLDPYNVRRILAETQIKATDRRVRYVGLAAYEAAGGIVVRDLFADEDSTYLDNPEIVDRLVIEKLETDALDIKAEGWAWIDAGADLSRSTYYHYPRLRPASLSREEIDRRDELREILQSFDDIAEYDDDIGPEDEAERVAATAELEALESRIGFTAEQRAQAGAVVFLNYDGTLAIERGLVNPKDAASNAPTPNDAPRQNATMPTADQVVDDDTDAAPTEIEEPEDDDTESVRPLSEALVTELSTSRTIALRNALGANPPIALHALVHRLVTSTMYPAWGARSCLEITPHSAAPRVKAPDLDQMPASIQLAERNTAWKARLPAEPEQVWDFLSTLSLDEMLQLLAHATSLTVNVIHERYSNRSHHVAQGDQLATALQFDMNAAGWRPTVTSYLSRVSKAHIAAAVTEACGKDQAAMMTPLKKDAMAKHAERLLANTGWLPEPLRSKAPPASADTPDPALDTVLPAFLDDDAAPDQEVLDGTADNAHLAVAAE